MLIVPAAFTGDTKGPEIATASSPRNENSPFQTDGAGANVTGADVPHETLTSTLFRMVNRMSVSNSGPAWATHSPFTSNDSGGSYVYPPLSRASRPPGLVTITSMVPAFYLEKRQPVTKGCMRSISKCLATIVLDYQPSRVPPHPIRREH
jgi:hypothetical protein